LILVSATAQTPQSNTKQSPFVLPVLKRDSLLNGLQLITLERPGTGTVSVHLRINSGALFDLAGKGGLADLTAGMLLRGGGGLNAKGITDLVESAGLTLRINVDWTATNIVVTGPADALETVFDLMGRIVVSPAFDQKELDSLKSDIIAAVKNHTDEATQVRLRAVESIFGSHPFGRMMRGSPESLAQVQRHDLQFYHERYYIANNATLIISGDTSAEMVTRFGRAKLGAWKKGEKVAPTFRVPDPQTARKVVILDRPELSTAYAALCQPGFSRRADNYFAGVILLDLLSRTLTKEVAARHGATIEVEYTPQLLTGPVLISIKADADAMPGVIDAVLQTMSSFQQSPLGVEQIENEKGRLVTAMADRLKTPDGMADVILDIETFGLGRDYLINYADRLGSLAPADVQAAARIILQPQAVAVAVSGPATKLDGPLKKLANVAVIR
jgi:zinc protease